MVEIKDIRVGDRIKLNDATVIDIENDAVIAIIDGNNALRSFYPSNIASIIPRPLKVGRAMFRLYPKVPPLTVLMIDGRVC